MAILSFHLHHCLPTNQQTWFVNKIWFNKQNIYLPTKPFSPTSLRAILSAKMEEFPWAMLAKGPA